MRALSLLLVATCVAAFAACSDRTGATGSSDAGATHPAIDPRESCAGCHPTHVAQWGMSSHAYAMHDPVFQAMIRVGQKQTQGELGDFCVKCHSPVGVATEQTAVTVDPDTGDHRMEFDGLGKDAMAGVSCLVCHSMTKVQKSGFNANFEMSHEDGIRRGPLRDPVPTTAHASEYSGIFLDTEMCAACHNVVNPKHEPLEQTHQEWVQSRFNGAQSCQDCHMPASRGLAAVGGTEREVHDHTMAGVDVSLLAEDGFPGYAELRTQAEALLRGSVVFTAQADLAARRLNLRIQNLAGHALPSGATADRELWVELLVRDPAGAVVLESGTLDERGDLRVPHAERTTRPGTDPSLALYTQEMYLDPRKDDPSSTEPRTLVDFLWEPNAHEDHLIPVSGRAEPSYDLSSLAPGRYTANVRLLFRSFPPHLLRKLEELAGLDPMVKARVPTVEVASATVDLPLE